MRDVRNTPVDGGSIGGTELIQEHQDTELLLDDLTNWLAELDEDHFDEAKLDALLDELERRAPLDRTFDPQASLEVFRREHRAEFDAIDAADPAAGNISGKKTFRFSLRKTLALAAVVAALVCLVSIQAAGFDFGDLFARWTGSLFGYSDVQTEYATVGAYPIAEGETKEYDSLQAALDDFGVKGRIAPTWMPEGLELTFVEAKVSSNEVTFRADYVSEDGTRCFITISEHDSAVQTITEKDREHMKVHKNQGITHHFVSDLDLEKAMWINGELECVIYGTVCYEDIKQIVDSIYGD